MKQIQEFKYTPAETDDMTDEILDANHNLKNEIMQEISLLKTQTHANTEDIKELKEKMEFLYADNSLPRKHDSGNPDLQYIA